MIALSKSLLQWIRRSTLRVRGADLAGGSRIGRRVRCRPGWRNGTCGQIVAGPGLQMEDGVILDAWGGKIELGRRVFLGPYVVIYGHGGVSIGDNVLVSMHCRILSSEHTLPPVGTDIRSQPDVLKPTRIGRDVWLGAGVTILGGVTIGDGCVVGAGAVVTKSLPAGAIAHGVPATVKSYRAS